MTLRIFRSLHDAKAEGYEVYDRAPTIFLVRKKTETGYVLASVVLMHQEEHQSA